MSNSKHHFADGTENRYVNYHRVFMAFTDRHKRLEEWMERRFDSLVLHPMYDKFAGEMNFSEPLRVLCVGSAEGTICFNLVLLMFKDKVRQLSIFTLIKT